MLKDAVRRRFEERFSAERMARDAGFTKVSSADGDVRDLVAHIGTWLAEAQVHIREDLTRGYTPSYLVHALVERRFSALNGADYNQCVRGGSSNALSSTQMN